MPYALLLAIAFVLAAGSAAAQTATRGNVPGSLPVTPPEASNAGSPRAHRHTEKLPGMTHRDKKRLRKLAKVPANSQGAMKTN